MQHQKNDEKSGTTSVNHQPIPIRFFLLLSPFLILFCDLFFGLSALTGDPEKIRCLFLMIWMLTWWISELLPLGVTALIPLFFLPPFGIMPVKVVSSHFSNPIILLFLGGFIIARGLEKTSLDKRIAMNILKYTGHSGPGILFGFILTTAFLSLWISNTATTVMMVPIALSVIHFLRENLDKNSTTGLENMTVILFLAIAYSANIGGTMTPVGTPPNVIFLGYLDEFYSLKIDFWKWMLITIPLGVSLLGAMMVLLFFLFPFQLNVPKTFQNFIQSKIKILGPLQKPQKITLVVFSLASFLWIFKAMIHSLSGSEFLNDTSIAIFCGFLLFLIPSHLQKWEPVLNQKDLSKLPWNIILLFGGGMALADALKTVGLIEMSAQFFENLQVEPYFLIFLIAGLSLLLTEVISNVALCMVLLPMIMKLGELKGIDPFLIAIPATLCSSFAFSMPISTPPNAIVFATNKLSMKNMLKAGVGLNFIALTLTMTLGYFFFR